MSKRTETTYEVDPDTGIEWETVKDYDDNGELISITIE